MASAAFYCRRSAFWRFSTTEASNRLHKTRVPSQPPYSLYIHKQLLRWDVFLIFSYCLLFEIPKLPWLLQISKRCSASAAMARRPAVLSALAPAELGTAADSAISARFETWRPPVRHCPSFKVFVKQKSHGERNNVSSFQSFGPSPSLHRHHAFLGLVAS